MLEFTARRVDLFSSTRAADSDVRRCVSSRMRLISPCTSDTAAKIAYKSAGGVAAITPSDEAATVGTYRITGVAGTDRRGGESPSSSEEEVEPTDPTAKRCWCRRGVPATTIALSRGVVRSPLVDKASKNPSSTAPTPGGGLAVFGSP